MNGEVDWGTWAMLFEGLYVEFDGQTRELGPLTTRVGIDVQVEGMGDVPLPPGEPMINFGFPSFMTMVGDIEDRGRLPGSTRLAIGTPFLCERNEKSVSSLLSRNPPTIKREPKPFSIVVVIERALPYWSTIEKWLVDGNSMASSSANRRA